MTEELKPCPFCGNDDVTVRWFPYNSAYYVQCNQLRCYSKGPDRLNKQEAVEAWNRRVTDE